MICLSTGQEHLTRINAWIRFHFVSVSHDDKPANDNQILFGAHKRPFQRVSRLKTALSSPLSLRAF